MTILGIDTTGDEVVIGVTTGDKFFTRHSAAKPHSRVVLPLIDELLSGKQPGAIVVSIGPGSYTGTRVGVTVANTLAWSWQVPVYGVPRTGAATMDELLAIGTKHLQAHQSSPRVLPLYPSEPKQ